MSLLAARDIPEEAIMRPTPRGAVLWLPEKATDLWCATQPCIWCAVCELVSFHPIDVAYEFCGRCGVFHEDVPAPEWMLSKVNE